MFYGMNRIDPLEKLDILKLKYDELFDSPEDRLLYYDKFNKLSERAQKSIKFQKFNLK